MLSRFKALSPAGKILAVILAIDAFVICWTIAASYMLTFMLGTLYRNYYTLDRVETYWFWWTVYLSDGRTKATTLWMWAAGISVLFPPGGLLARRLIDQFSKTKNLPPLFGETHAATESEMRQGGLIIQDAVSWEKGATK